MLVSFEEELICCLSYLNSCPVVLVLQSLQCRHLFRIKKADAKKGELTGNEKISE